MKTTDDDLITTAEAARILGVTVQMVRRFALLPASDPHRLPAQRVGRDWVYRRGDVRRYTPRKPGRPATKTTSKQG